MFGNRKKNCKVYTNLNVEGFNKGELYEEPIVSPDEFYSGSCDIGIDKLRELYDVNLDKKNAKNNTLIGNTNITINCKDSYTGSITLKCNTKDYDEPTLEITRIVFGGNNKYDLTFNNSNKDEVNSNLNYIKDKICVFSGCSINKLISDYGNSFTNETILDKGNTTDRGIQKGYSSNGSNGSNNITTIWNEQDIQKALNEYNKLMNNNSSNSNSNSNNNNTNTDLLVKQGTYIDSNPCNTVYGYNMNEQAKETNKAYFAYCNGNEQWTISHIGQLFNQELNNNICGYEINSGCQEFIYTGNEQTFDLTDKLNVKMQIWGGQGYSNDLSINGKGGYGYGTLKNEDYNNHNTLYINVAGAGNGAAGGYNGGGSGSTTWPYGGGGATHIATRSGLLKNLVNYKSNVLLVAGGSGGENTWGGGAGGGMNGGNSKLSSEVGGGKQNTFGNNATSTSCPSAGFGYGADGSNCDDNGGGAGYYGGGIGFGSGGGSGYIGGVNNGSWASDIKMGNGFARICWGDNDECDSGNSLYTVTGNCGISSGNCSSLSMTGATFTTTSANSGTTITGSCDSGYYNSNSGKVSAYCDNGEWVYSGSCVPYCDKASLRSSGDYVITSAPGVPGSKFCCSGGYNNPSVSDSNRVHGNRYFEDGVMIDAWCDTGYKESADNGQVEGDWGGALHAYKCVNGEWKRMGTCKKLCDKASLRSSGDYIITSAPGVPGSKFYPNYNDLVVSDESKVHDSRYFEDGVMIEAWCGTDSGYTETKQDENGINSTWGGHAYKCVNGEWKRMGTCKKD